MPPRLNKRQQRELEELEALKQAKPVENQEESSEDEELDSDDDDEEEEVSVKKSKKSKKKKKKPAEQSVPAEAPTPKESAKSTPRTSTPVAPVRNEKKALKKARAKEKKAANDELDKALAELSIQYPASQKISQAEAGKASLADLLSVSLQHLDGEAEMRRFFGSRVVQANRTEGSSNRKKPPTVKSNLTRPQPTWWAAKGREGLSLRALTDGEVDELLKRHRWTPMQEKWWTVEYSKKYRSMTKAFMDAVLAGDPQGLWDLLGALPWHADTLLQISEVYRHRDEHAQAVDFIDRALFTYERAFIGAFTFTSGLNRLDFDYVENRPFFLAIHRQVVDLQRRGCVRTSFEFARLMYSLDPWSDPHGSLFHLDFLAIKAGMHQWLLDVYDNFESRRGQEEDKKQNTRLDPSLLPGWAFSRALALHLSEESAKMKDYTASTLALKQAARDFPAVIPLMADKLDVSLPANIRSHRDFKIVTDAISLSTPVAILHLLSHLYTQRSSAIWKDHSAWFTATITEEFATLPTSLPVTERRQAFLTQYESKTLQYSVYRHIMVLETSYRRLFSFIPRQVLEAKSIECDPLPPLTALTRYDQQFFQGVDDLLSARRHRTRRERALDERRLAQMIPDAAFRQQMQAFFDANPHFAERFPGGILQFAQMAGQLPPDMLEDLMAIEAMNNQGNMPGQFGMAEGAGGDNMPGGHFDFGAVGDVPPLAGGAFGGPGAGGAGAVGAAAADADLDDSGSEAGSGIDREDEDSDEEDVSPMPRFVRNILGRFFGRNNAADAEGSSSDDNGDVDDAPPTRDDLGVD
ncbi:DUF654-domain-containing protein [Agrocybe pediades]|nr:DUF654-domain-containing protein [Agrocybe pediades]